jgi:hypothetical protein
MRCALLLLLVVVALCAADRTQVFTGVILEGQSSVSIPWGEPLPGHGLIINSNANASHSLLTTLNPRLAYAVWSASDKLWEASWTATSCDTASANVQKDINIVLSCHTAEGISRCPTNTAYSIVVTEYNTTLAPWNPDNGALRWTVTIGGLSTSATWNLTLDYDNSNLLDSRSDLHVSILTQSGLPSSATASLFAFGSKDTDWQSCDLWEEKPEEKASFSGHNAMFLTHTAIHSKTQYVLLFNATEPRNTYEILVHATPSLKKSAPNLWVFVAVAVACFIVGGILVGICTTFLWRDRGERDRERDPFVRDSLNR